MNSKRLQLRLLAPVSVAALMALAGCTTQLPAGTPEAAAGAQPTIAVQPTLALSPTAAAQPETPLVTTTVTSDAQGDTEAEGAAESEGGMANDATAITSTLPVPESAIEREEVVFAAGETTQEISSLLPSGPGVNQYVLNAAEGQVLTVDATSDGTPLSMTIESPSGNKWIPEMRTTDEGYAIGHELTVPESGEYVVTLVKADHTPSTNFTLTFTLQ